VVSTSGSVGDSGVNFGVVRYDPGALLLTSLAASEGGWDNANRGLWRLDLDSAIVTQVVPKAVAWNLLSPHAAWRSDVDPAGGPPVAAPPPDIGTMPNRLVRLDLTTGTTQTWITRPGKIVTLLGVDLMDRPLLRIQSANSTEIDYSTAPDQTTIMYRSASAATYGPSDDLNATGAGYAPVRLWWIPTASGWHTLKKSLLSIFSFSLTLGPAWRDWEASVTSTRSTGGIRQDRALIEQGPRSIDSQPR
jgi:hypothetical protein